MQLQLGVHGRQSQAHCQPPLGLRQRAQRLRLRPLQPLLPAGRRIWHSGRAERGLSLRTAAESGFGLTRQAGRDWLQSLLSRFGPMNDRASNAHVLDFERPLVELDNRIKEVLPCPALYSRPVCKCRRLWGVLPAAGGRGLSNAHMGPGQLGTSAYRLRLLDCSGNVRAAGAESGGGQRRGRVWAN